MMRLCAVLILFTTMSAAYGLRCYTCAGMSGEPCTNVMSCPSFMDRCFTLSVHGFITKACQTSVACVDPMVCCKGDLCNSAIPSTPSVLLLLLCSAIITLFL